MTRGDALLSVRGLKKHYPVTRGLLRREVGRVRAVDGVDFDLAAGETLGIVGESGCGKSTTARTLLHLEAPTAGTVTFDGERVDDHDRAARKRFRRRTGMVFQDPTSSFDPRMSVGEAVAEPLRIHGLRGGERRRAVVEDILPRVGLGAADYDRYPHELSGGQKQRAALARALILNPDLLVADEPVSALDVSVQAEILALLDRLQSTFDLSVLLVTHDMSVVRQACDRVAVMYLGEIVEAGPTEAVFADPAHPYTEALLASVPTPDPTARKTAVELTGGVPDPASPPPGCRFHPRCPAVIPPEEVDLDRETWRAVLDLRLAVEGDSSGATEPPEPASLRADHGVPATLPDPEAEAALADALAALAEGRADEAAERLRASFPTVCRRESPDRHEIDGRRVSCHLHDRPLETAEEQSESPRFESPETD